MRGGVHHDPDVGEVTQREPERNVSLLVIERHDAHLGEGERDEGRQDGQAHEERPLHGRNDTENG